MHTTVTVSADLNRAIMLRSHHQRNSPRSKPLQQKKRTQAVYGTKSYRDGLQRAFNKAKMQIYFNPDMKYFITLTYRKADNTVEEVLKDVKLLIKRETRRAQELSHAGSGRKAPKYVFVMEYQDRGSIHVHMIANDFFTLQVNSNGYRELAFWPHGYTSVLTINDFDGNFRSHLYLFKYMRKAQRIGKSFVHSSRGLTNYTTLDEGSINLEDWNTINMERTETEVQTPNGPSKLFYYRNYLQFDDTINLQQLNNLPKGDLSQWHEQVKLHSKRELEKILANHLLR